MKKIVALLVAPLLAVGMLVGCSKVEYSATDVQSLFNEYMDSYIENGENELFLNNVIATDAEGDETDFSDIEGTLQSTYEKIMYISYDDQNGLNAAVQTGAASGNVAVKTRQLREVYQRILSLSFNYYAEWNANFYQNIADTQIAPEELNNLYELMIDLQQQTENFVLEKEELEREVRMNENGLNGSLVLVKFDEFNTAYNNLLQKSFAFLNEFKNLHKKYIFSTNELTPNAAKQLVDESLLMIAEAVFYDNVLAFQQNETTAFMFMSQIGSGEYGSQYNWVTRNYWQYLTVEENGNLFANTNIKAQISEESTETVGDNLVTNTEYSEQAQLRVQELRTYANGFAQDFNNYKAIFKNTNRNNYNYARDMGDKPSTFDESKLSLQEQSNLQYMKNFSLSKMFGMFNALFRVMEPAMVD